MLVFIPNYEFDEMAQDVTEVICNKWVDFLSKKVVLELENEKLYLTDNTDNNAC